MTAGELKRKLGKIGCAFSEGKKHTRIFRGNRESLMPRHPSKEIKKGTLNGILKDLGIDKI